MASLLLALPGEIRNEILCYLLPDQKIVAYQCELGREHGLQPKHHTCGQGPGWSCLREKIQRPLDILRVNRQLYAEASSLLYNRTFVLGVDESPFFVNSFDFRSFESFPWHIVKKMTLNIYFQPRTSFRTFLLCKRFARCWRDLSRSKLEINIHFSGADKSETIGVLPTVTVLLRISCRQLLVNTHHPNHSESWTFESRDSSLASLKEHLESIYDLSSDF